MGKRTRNELMVIVLVLLCTGSQCSIVASEITVELDQDQTRTVTRREFYGGRVVAITHEYSPNRDMTFASFLIATDPVSGDESGLMQETATRDGVTEQAFYPSEEFVIIIEKYRSGMEAVCVIRRSDGHIVALLGRKEAGTLDLRDNENLKKEMLRFNPQARFVK